MLRSDGEASEIPPAQDTAATSRRAAPQSEHGSVASASALLLLRRALTLVTAGLSTALLSRMLQPASFGELQVGLAAWTFATGMADLAFSQVLGRELVATGRERAALLRTGYQVQGMWALFVTAGLAGAGLLAGADTTSGQVLLVMCPTVAATGLAGGRAVLLAMNDVRVLVRVDLLCNIVLSVGMVLAAMAGGGPVAVAAVFSLFTAANALVLGVIGQRRSGLATPARGARRRLVHLVVPLSLASVFGKIYLTAPLLMLGWLSTSEDAGQFGGAARIIATLNTVVAVVMAAALPALARARARDEPAAFAALATKLLGWLVLGALPLFIVVGVLSGPVTRLALGPSYGEAGELTAVLACAGLLATLTQLFQTILVSASHTRPMLYQSAAAALLCTSGNILLIPSYGGHAAAWLTVVTELLVCAGAIVSARALMPSARLLHDVWRPVLVVGASGAVLALLSAWPLPAIAAAAVTYAILTWQLRCWPTDWRRPLHR
jgi:O-antigen/teichoic acid export membrane protein